MHCEAINYNNSWRMSWGSTHRVASPYHWSSCIALHFIWMEIYCSLSLFLVSFPFHLICDCCVTNDAFSERRRCIIKIASRMLITVGCFVCFSGHDPRHRQLDLLLSVRPSAVIIHLLAMSCVLLVAYEKGHQRPALTVYTFQNPEATGVSGGPVTAAPTSAADIAQRASSSSIASRPPIPVVSSV